MNCRTLEYIVAVKESGSFKAAAAQCHVTVGTISGQITRLENYLGIKIFNDRSAPVELNPRATKIYAVIAETVAGMQLIKQLARTPDLCNGTVKS